MGFLREQQGAARAATSQQTAAEIAGREEVRSEDEWDDIRNADQERARSRSACPSTCGPWLVWTGPSTNPHISGKRGQVVPEALSSGRVAKTARVQVFPGGKPIVRTLPAH
jgi:hypothetical protein